MAKKINWEAIGIGLLGILTSYGGEGDKVRERKPRIPNDTVRQPHEPDPVEKWAKAIDRDVALWATFVSNMAKYEVSSDDVYLKRAKDALFYFFQNLEGGKYDRVMFTEHKDDAVVGGYSDISSLDMFANYSQSGRIPLFIKRMSIEDAHQVYHDSKFTSKNFSRDQFYLAPVRYHPIEYGGFALLVTQIVPGPDIGEIFSVLNGEIKSGNSNAERIKSMILDKNLEDLILWQEHFHQTVPEEVASTQKRPDIIINRYKSNMHEAVENAQKLTYAQPNFSLIVSDLENELVKVGLQLFDGINLKDERIARIRDDTETNSGLELGTIKFRSEKELYEAVVRTVSKPATNGDTHKNGIITPEGRIISHDKINELYAHWDVATGKFGHFLEDFYRAIDSYSLNITDFEKSTRYRQFLGRKFGSHAEEHDITLDSQLIRFFRNLRHRDVVISQFARNNEQRYLGGSKEESARNLKRADYTAKVEHYINISLESLDKTIDEVLHNLVPHPEMEKLSEHLHSATTLNKVLSHTNEPWVQNEIDSRVGEMKAIIGGTSYEPARILGQLYALYYITKKMASFKNIRFDKLI